MEINDLLHTDGDDNTAGIAQHAIFSILGNIQVLPKPKLDNSASETGTVEDLVTIADDVVFKPGKKPVKIYCTLEAGSITSEATGGLDGMTYVNKATLFYPGSKKQGMGLFQWIKNGSGILWVQELDGSWRQIGHELYPAKVESISFTSGSKPGDVKGTTIVLKDARKGPAPFFEGNFKVSGVGSGADADGDGNFDIYMS